MPLSDWLYPGKSAVDPARGEGNPRRVVDPGEALVLPRLALQAWV
ncbi:hypothetical protein [Rhodovulum sulfidophilum]|nr:hypothetical protein [Rhodovulum sulfidophilum]